MAGGRATNSLQMEHLGLAKLIFNNMNSRQIEANEQKVLCRYSIIMLGTRNGSVQESTMEPKTGHALVVYDLTKRFNQLNKPLGKMGDLLGFLSMTRATNETRHKDKMKPNDFVAPLKWLLFLMAEVDGRLLSFIAVVGLKICETDSRRIWFH